MGSTGSRERTRVTTWVGALTAPPLKHLWLRRGVRSYARSATTALVASPAGLHPAKFFLLRRAAVQKFGDVVADVPTRPPDYSCRRDAWRKGKSGVRVAVSYSITSS